MVRDLQAEILGEIGRIVADQTAGRAILPSDHLVNDLGLDSIDLTILAVGLEDHFRIRLSEEDSTGVGTVDELAKLVARRFAEAQP